MANTWMKRVLITGPLGLLLSTTAIQAIAQDFDALAARGQTLAAADPLSADLRSRLNEAGRTGFDIGMGVAEKDTLPGPGKQRIHDLLPVDQQASYDAAVLFQLTRNANYKAVLDGATIARADSALTTARRADDDPFFALGFDIATGLLHGHDQGALGNSQQFAANAVHDTLSGATKRGFEASARLHGVNY